MTLMDAHNRYGAVSRLLHWLMALLLIFMLASDWWMEALEDVASDSGMPLHQTIGTLILALLLCRLIWRTANKGRIQPPENWQWAARLGHLVLYGLMLVIPVSGLLTAWASGHGIELLGISLVAPGPEIEWLEEAGEEIHEVLANLLWLALAGHVLAALAHQYLMGDGTLRKMA